MAKLVYRFGNGAAEGKAAMRPLLGGKGANLAEMSNLGLPVPPGLTLTTEVCTHYANHDGDYPDGMREQVADAIVAVETIMGRKFHDSGNPLLLSIRSGGRASMPGMMDTVLNLGLNDQSVEGLSKVSGDARFAYDSYRRFIQMYGDVVLGVDHHNFEELLHNYKEDNRLVLDTDLTGDDWKHIAGLFKKEVEKHLGHTFPQDPDEQLWRAIGAVFGSWNNQRAMTYRRLHDIPDDWGTAVNVQAMVFGNMGDTCATGVCFTRNPSTGENAYYGEYLINAQGEDVVAGIRTPQPMTIAGREVNHSELPSLEEAMPDIFAELLSVRGVLEQHFKDMQDIEFTIENRHLWMLQTRSAKRTAAAAIKIACDMVEEGLIEKSDAVMRIDPIGLNQLLHPTLDPDADRVILARGLPASPGAASGEIVFTSEDAEMATERGASVILVRVETSPEDISGMYVAKGILTTRGGMTSHAAVVARGMGTPCISGANEIKIDLQSRTMKVLGTVIEEGDKITIDGGTGEVMLGEVPTVQSNLTGDFALLMDWADEFRSLGVRANADTPADARTAAKFGAEGIGLCRTEHMFFDAERIVHIRRMIIAGNETERRAALDCLLPYQRRDFIELFKIMDGNPVTIRLLDPPLHEFLPHSEKELEKVAKAAGVSPLEAQVRAAELAETNPMLGHRGCRLAIAYPEIYEMQARAIFEAAVHVTKDNIPVHPEVMIPLVAYSREFEILRDLVNRIAGEVMKDAGVKIDYQVGTMIELPRAALRAGDIAERAEFFSFGTNDLTQTALGLSRDDAGRFISYYREQKIFETDPFQTLDQVGVGELIRIGIERGRAARSDIKIGICGEHGGDPASIGFFHRVGMDYVSCSPYRVPIARLAAAQAALGVDGHAED